MSSSMAAMIPVCGPITPGPLPPPGYIVRVTLILAHIILILAYIILILAYIILILAYIILILAYIILILAYIILILAYIILILAYIILILAYIILILAYIILILAYIIVKESAVGQSLGTSMAAFECMAHKTTGVPALGAYPELTVTFPHLSPLINAPSTRPMTTTTRLWVGMF